MERVYYESKEDAYTRFRDQFKDLPDMVRNVSPDVLPESYRVKLRTRPVRPGPRPVLARAASTTAVICNPGSTP